MINSEIKQNTIIIDQPRRILIDFQDYEIFVGEEGSAPFVTGLTDLGNAHHIYEHFPITHLEILEAYVQHRINKHIEERKE